MHDRSNGEKSLVKCVKTILPALAEKYTLAINTSLADVAIEQKLEDLDLATYFRIVLWSTSGDKVENLQFI